MGWLSNRGAPKGSRRSGPRRVALRDITGGHSRDPGRRLAARHERLPIEVEAQGRGYRLIDGGERVGRARDRGDRTIRAYVWERP